LTQLEKSLPRLRNYAVAVKEWNDEIIFVRQVVRGAADRSYGIHVARLAGLPPEVIARAREILGRLEAEGQALQVQLRRSLAESSRPARDSDGVGKKSRKMAEIETQKSVEETGRPQMEFF